MPQKPEHTFILQRLREELPPYLHYHRLEHTLDVYACAGHLAIQENLSDAETRLLLTAAAYHDSGYLYQSDGHEERSCGIARESLPSFGYSDKEIDAICELIMATQVPQKPQNHLEQIICDADLDYLGRPDFYELGDRLFQEMSHLGSVLDRDHWNTIQVAFLKSHHFFTDTSKKTRQPVQDAHLQELLNKTN